MLKELTKIRLLKKMLLIEIILGLTVKMNQKKFFWGTSEDWWLVLYTLVREISISTSSERSFVFVISIFLFILEAKSNLIPL